MKAVEILSTVEIEQRAQSRRLTAPVRIGQPLPSTAQLLVEGGDTRIMLDPDRAVNKYGCRPLPDPQLLAFGSSTASVISAAGFAAAEHLRHRLLLNAGSEAPSVTYARELDRVRRELLRLCGVSDLPGVELVFAASGTDLHLIVAQLAGSGATLPTRVIMVDAAETGSCVPTALAGRHFSSRAALGDAVSEGADISGGAGHEVVTVAIRDSDGNARPTVVVDAEVEDLVTTAAELGQRVLLILVDVSKTGLIAPSPACVASLHQRFAESIHVLVDACQFRIAPSTLRAYLEQGFMLALTGSKFVTGPTFAGALLLPAAVARRLRRQPLPRALRAYSTQADWPKSWATAGILNPFANFGLLLRWEAALQELRSLRAVPEAKIARFLQDFANAVQQRLANDTCLAPLPVPAIDRRPLVDASRWDTVQTIFPFLLFHPGSDTGKTPLSIAETQEIYRLLQVDLGSHPHWGHIGLPEDSAALRCQLGQPVLCGTRKGVPVSALRLCASARLVVAATAQEGGGAAVIAEAMAVLDKAVGLVRAGFASLGILRR
jgi:hypothetical protein